jgi:DNA-binding CsgD family transcriptional regulator
MLADAIEPWLHAGHPERAYRAGEDARALLPATAERQRVEVELRLGDVLGWQGRDAEACALWRGLAATVDASPELRNDAWSRYRAGEALFSAGDDGNAARHLRGALESTRTSGSTSALPQMSVVLVWTLCRLGELAAARKAAGEAVAAAIALGNVGDEAWCLAAHSWVDAMTGDELSCRRHAADADVLARRLGLPGMETSDMSLGLLVMSLGRHAAAVTHLERAMAEHERRGAGDAAAPRSVTGLLVEALVRAGREGEARARLQAFEAALLAPVRPTSRAAVARCRGLLADDFAGDFAEAIALYEAAGHRFDVARTQLCFGMRLRRMRRRSDARVQLRAAEATLAEIGAVQWQARAAEELAATGERRQVDASAGLTPHELRVAELVSTGLTNREVAAVLYLSEKTIEAHLGRVFRKLDVRSRTGLAAALSRSYPREFPDSTDGVRA